MKYTESAWQFASAFMASNLRFGHNPTEVLAEAITKRDAAKDAEIERLRKALDQAVWNETWGDGPLHSSEVFQDKAPELYAYLREKEDENGN